MTNSKSYSFFKGYSFSFDVDGNEVSGLEKIFVDGELVSSQRNYSTDSTNIFRIGDNDYEATLKVESTWRGPCVCTLKKNGTALKRKKLVFPRHIPLHKTRERRVPGLIRHILFVLLSVLSGFFWVYFGYSDIFIYGSIAILFVVLFGCGLSENNNSSNKEKCKPVIEDEKIE